MRDILKELRHYNEDIESTVLAGSSYNTIADVVDCKTGKSEDLVHDGKVWLIEYWATWCPPCQRPMHLIQEMALKN